MSPRSSASCTAGRAALAVLAAVGAAFVTGCSAGPGASSGAPPLVVCGQTVWTGAEGAVLQVSAGGTVTTASAGGNLFLKVGAGCSRGVTVSVSPDGAARTVASSASSDGRSAAVVLKPARNDFRIVLGAAEGTSRTVVVRLGSTMTVPGTTG